MRGSRDFESREAWQSFIDEVVRKALAIDFFTVSTVTFDILYVFVVLSLERRLILHVNMTAHLAVAERLHREAGRYVSTHVSRW